MFEMFENPKRILQKVLRLNENFGDKALNEFALFLDKYRLECSSSIPTPALTEVFRFTALSRINPKQATQEFLKAYEAGSDNQVKHMKRLAEEIAPVVNKNQDSATPLQIAIQLVSGVELYKEGKTIEGIQVLKTMAKRIRANHIPNSIKTKVPEEIWQQLPLHYKDAPEEKFTDIQSQISRRLGIELREEPDLEQLMKFENRNTYSLDNKGEIIGLNICSNGLTDDQIDFVWDLRELQVLNLSNNRLKKISLSKKMTKLININLSNNNELGEINFIENLTNLEKIRIRGCNITSIKFPLELQRLKIIDLRNNVLMQFRKTYQNYQT